MPIPWWPAEVGEREKKQTDVDRELRQGGGGGEENNTF